MKSNIWLKRHAKDIYVKEAQLQGFVSRSAFKLIEIDKKYQLISKSSKILEIGSSPGGWSQVILKLNKNTQLDAFDLLDMKYSNKKINFFKVNVLKFDFDSLNKKYDLILSDIAPNTTGHKSTDHLRIVVMLEEILNIVDNISLPKSNLVFKIWKGIDEKKIINQIKIKYKNFSYFKPKASRNDSSEIYIIARNYIK